MTMKKILLSFLALGGLLFASSCQMDEPDAGTLTGEVDFSITAGIPSGITTYAPEDEQGAFSHLGGINNVTGDYVLRFILEVYDGDAVAYTETKYLENFSSPKVTFNPRLLAKKYDFVFWADFVAKPSDGSTTVNDLYYNTSSGLTAISYNKDNVTATVLTTDLVDAYYVKENVDLTQSSQSLQVTLQRPFGKIRLLATDKDIANNDTETPVSVKLDFGSAKFLSSFNALTGDVTGEFAVNAVTTSSVKEDAQSVDGTTKYEGAYLLGYIYAFASTPQAAYPIDVTVYSDADATSQIGYRELTNIPVSANKLTTVVGNFYSNEGNLEVKVEDMFTNGEEEVPVPIVIGSYEELSKAFIDGGDYMLSSDITIPKNQIVKISEGTKVGINLNGHVLSTTNSEGQTFQDMFEVVGTLNISNGTVQFQYTGDNMGWNGGTAVFNVHGGGILNMEDVVVNDLGGTDMSFCVHLNNWGDVTLNADNCEFNSPYCGVRVFNSGPQMNNVMITNSKLTGATRAFWVHNYIGDISNATEEEIKNRLNIDIYNNNNTFSLTGTAISPIRYGFDNPVYFTENGELVDLVIDDSEKTVQISSASAMSAFAVMVNNGEAFENYTVTLTADIDLQDQAWTPIGPNADADNKFKGTFDGGYHTISNLKVTQEADYHAAGLFGALNGTVRNLTIDGATISNLSSRSSTTNGTAVVAGSIYNTGLIENVTVRNADVNANRYVGGIAGYVYGSIKGCTVETVTLVATPDNLTGSYDNGDKAGGIVGYSATDNGGEISGNTARNITLKGYRDIGGIAGAANGSDLKNNTASDISITVDQATGHYGDKDANAGTILGRNLGGTLDDTNTESGENTISYSYLISTGSSRINDDGIISFSPESNSTYYVAEGEYQGLQVFTYGKSNVSIIAQGDVTINGTVSFGTHSNRNRLIPENTRFEGFKVNGLLSLYACGTLVAENNQASQLTIKTFGLTNDPLFTSDITLKGNTIDGNLANPTQQGYAVFIVPNVTGYKLTVDGNTFKNVQSHCFTIQGCGDGSAITTIGEYSFTNNKFESWGLGNKENRGAIKVWADTEIAPADMTSSSVSDLSQKAKDFVTHILNGNNDFKTPLDSNCCIFEFYGLAFNSLQ